MLTWSVKIICVMVWCYKFPVNFHFLKCHAVMLVQIVRDCHMKDLTEQYQILIVLGS